MIYFFQYKTETYFHNQKTLTPRIRAMQNSEWNGNIYREEFQDQ